jgi:hypothetical protein
MNAIEFDRRLAEVVQDPGVTILSHTLMLYPYCDIIRRTSNISSAFIGRAKDESGE